VPAWQASFSNVDLLAWFSEEERQVCAACGERTAVTVPEAVASFCLRCGAVMIEGLRIDIDDRVPVLAHRRDPSPPSPWSVSSVAGEERAGHTDGVGSLAKELRALETTEKVLAALTFASERDDAIRRLTDAIDQDRAELLAAVLGSGGREPKHVHNPVGS
jgi:hypothetical protein